MDTCKLLKQKLWKHRHVLNYEWDGTIYGGGVIGQRYWEYLKFVDLMELNSESVVLELGGGSPITGRCFFGECLKNFVKKVIVVDPYAPNSRDNNLICMQQLLTPESMESLFHEHQITHLASVSVIEHIPHEELVSLVSAMNRLRFENIVLSFEFHSVAQFVTDQLTTSTASKVMDLFTNYHLSAMERSPMGGVTAFTSVEPVCEKWYPLMLKFERNIDC